MKKLNFEQMENISAGLLSQNQICVIEGGIFALAALTLNFGFAAGVAVGALYYGCFWLILE